MKTIDFIRRSIISDLEREFATPYDVIVSPCSDFFKVKILGSLIGAPLIDYIRDNYSPYAIVVTPCDDYKVRLSFSLSCTKD